LRFSIFVDVLPVLSAAVGVYFAKERETAENYRGELSDDTDIIFYYGDRYKNTSDGGMVSSGNEAGNIVEYDDPTRLDFNAMSANSGNIAGAIQDFESKMDDLKCQGTPSATAIAACP